MPLALDKEDDSLISVEGSRADLEQLAQFISDPHATDASQLFSNFKLEVKNVAGNVALRRLEPGQIVIEGGQKQREILAENLLFLARQPDRVEESKHIHIEYHGDNSYLSATSEPAVFSLRDEGRISEERGTCEHCAAQFSYRLVHNGWSNTAYAYCDTCGCTALFHELGPIPPAAPIRFQKRIGDDVEQFLRPCDCGGHFRASAVPRCPSCSGPISADNAASYIEANAPGTSKGWTWQRNWSDYYCIIINQREAREPWGSLTS